ncbi:hypothetical protein AJ79_02539 [Helicocarpus griseus UAMH5409]|uniref:aldehyde dehydrogenase (NAD(+)) n=1 Tax=Helicocarpus griseus UAMH5409 TaxID=1447875 RepID=A0A2B7XTS9_9EURO|nr:hypothetical protein AJ79_02539 [Helicocarpus griseus UAMH5409]
MSHIANLTAPNGINYTQPLGLFIDNEWVASKKEDRIISINPADESEICSEEAAGSEDVDIAVNAARRAFDGKWREMDTSFRGDLLHKLATLVEQHADVLATIDAWDNGKTYNAARNEDVPDSVAILKYYAGWADKIHGTVIEPNPSRMAYTSREPIGVCGAIIPWNFPLVNIVTKLGPALAAGNTLVVKVAEQTPLSALYFANLVKEAGFPRGVVNVLNGMGREAGTAIAAHPGIDMISFTGSTPTGREILKTAAVNMKRVILETGGKSPLIVFKDADLEQAVRWGHRGIMSNQGQVCSATSRIFVHEDVYDRFLALYKDEVQKVSQVGDPFKEDTFQGPQVSKAQFDRVSSYIDTGKREGAKLLCGGEACKNMSGKGLYIAPTVFTDVSDSMTISRDEVFGPFVVISKFNEEKEAIKRANDSVFGLGAAVFTRDISRALSVSKKIESGTVWINSSNDSDGRVPFGGFKQSGIGLELGELGLAAYTISKSVFINLNSKL